MPLNEWITHDEYWQEAIYQSVSAMVEARNKRSKEESEKILEQIKDSKESAPYVSPFAGISKPTFQMG